MLGFGTDIFTTIQEVDKLPDQENEIGKEEDVFGYWGRPSMDVDDYSTFRDSLINDSYPDGLGDKDIEKKVDQPISQNYRTIYTVHDYPLSREVYFKFECNQPVTYGILLYAYTIAYQLIYKLEDEDSGDPGFIQNTFNRSTSNGKFGIWGHYIGDLVYNGISRINYYPNEVVCYFSCDS